MRKIVVVSILFLLVLTPAVKCQDCTFYFPKKTGTSFEMTHYNAKDKITGVTKTVIEEQTANSIKFSSSFFDNKGKLVSSGDYKVFCKNGEFEMDMSSFMNNMNLSAYKNMEVKISTDTMTLPAKLEPGEKLNDGEISIKISNQGFSIMNMTTRIYNRVMEGFEDVKTPAGTFKCARISYQVDTKSIFTMHTKGVEFISRDMGIVRAESYDSNGKLLSYSVLSSITN